MIAELFCTLPLLSPLSRLSVCVYVMVKAHYHLGGEGSANLGFVSGNRSQLVSAFCTNVVRGGGGVDRPCFIKVYHK